VAAAVVQGLVQPAVQQLNPLNQAIQVHTDLEIQVVLHHLNHLLQMTLPVVAAVQVQPAEMVKISQVSQDLEVLAVHTQSQTVQLQFTMQAVVAVVLTTVDQALEMAAEQVAQAVAVMVDIILIQPLKQVQQIEAAAEVVQVILLHQEKNQQLQAVKE
jgi:hypothetical protein